MNLTPASKPTFYFVGVSTKHSSIMKVFPEWAKHLQLGDVKISGIDLPLNAPANDYRKVTEFIKRDPLSVGALVTTHKLNLFQASQDLFDLIDDHAIKMNETSCLYKRVPAVWMQRQRPHYFGLCAGLHFTRASFPQYRWRSVCDGSWWQRDGDLLAFGAGIKPGPETE